jgi:hypothetical protein
MSPLDIRSAILAKHAQHVVLIHFPIALFLTGVAFDFAAHWTKRATVAAAAYANLLVAAVSVPPVVASGILAWQWQLAGKGCGGSCYSIWFWDVSLVCSSVGLVGSTCGHGGSSARYRLPLVCSSSSWPLL